MTTNPTRLPVSNDLITSIRSAPSTNEVSAGELACNEKEPTQQSRHKHDNQKNVLINLHYSLVAKIGRNMEMRNRHLPY